MLLIDGVKYELWTPSTEDEFEQVVKEHTQEIFGERSVYLDLKQKLKSRSGIGSIPDGYVIILKEPPEWHIVEVELSSHPLHEHVVSQVSKFINGIKNPLTAGEILGTIYAEITGDDFLRLKVKKATEPVEIFKFLSDITSKPPVLTIIIEKDTEGLREAISTLAYPQEIKLVEFKTFKRVGAETVHAHLFEPLYKPIILPPKSPVSSPPPSANVLEIPIQNPSFIKFHVIYFPRDRRSFFPGYKIPFIVETDVDEISTYVSSAPQGTAEGDPTAGVYIQANVANWYRKHPELKVGDRVRITSIEPMKKYRLEIIK